VRATGLDTEQTFALIMDHGDDFFTTLETFCAENTIPL
jgi:predicted DNA-binding protein with PD1-like motif